VSAQFQTRKELVDYVNAQNPSWVAGVDHRFGRLPIGASKPLLGVKPNNKKVRAEAVALGKIVRAPEPTPQQIAAIPASFDAATAWPQCAKIITDIRDQSNCGCCWAFGATEAASDRMCIATNATIQLPLSVQELCFCASSDGCSGGDTSTPWLYIQYEGLSSGADQGNGPFDNGGYCSAFSLPHCHHHGPQGQDPYPDEGAPGCASQTSPACPTKCDPTARPPHTANDKYTFNGTLTTYSNAQQIQIALMNSGPLEVAFTVYSDFENYVSGIYHYVSGDELGGHAVEVVGWGTENGVDFWKIKNSWNPYWGEKGYFRIRRGTDECGIEDDATAPADGAIWRHM